MNIEQFEELLKEINTVYIQSGLEAKNLYYSLVGTKIQPNQPLIVGLNWGGGSDNDKDTYQAQTVDSYQEYIDNNTHFFSEGLEAGSLLNIKPYIEKYTNIDINTAHIGWTNFCFFRTPNDSTLTYEAMQLSIPIFLKLVETINPSMIIGFSSKLRDYLTEQNMLDQVQHYQAKNENKINKYNGYKAVLNNHCPIYMLPHPNAQVGNVARRNAWEYCFGKDE